MFKNLRFIYITTKNRDEARHIGKKLLEERLAACVNILDGMESMYHWKGNIETDNECVMIVKTPYHHVTELTRRVKEMHSYECPCIVSLTITEQEGNEEFLQWIWRETEEPPIIL